MAQFKFEAKDRNGDVVKGTMSGDNEAAISQKLKSQGLTVVSVKKGLSLDIKLSFGGSVTAKDLKTFTRQFATMIDAGLPLVQCLDILGSQSENKWFGEKLLEVKGLVEGGSTFSEALGKYPRIFDELFVALIAAGEMGGILDVIMKRLAEYIEKKERLQRQVKGAMVYPIGILTIMIAVVVVLLKWVIPTFEKMFEDFGAVDSMPYHTDHRHSDRDRCRLCHVLPVEAWPSYYGPRLFNHADYRSGGEENCCCTLYAYARHPAFLWRADLGCPGHGFQGGGKQSGGKCDHVRP
jgi:type IV pilus assembly protein PilC